MAPEPNELDVPLAVVPCQYQVVPVGGVPERVIVTELHCGELLVGFEGVSAETTVIVILTHPELHKPFE